MLSKNFIILANNACLGIGNDTFNRSYGKIMRRNKVSFDVSKTYRT